MTVTGLSLTDYFLQRRVLTASGFININVKSKEMGAKATWLFFLRSILTKDISRDWGSGKSKAKHTKSIEQKPYRRPQDLVPGSELAGMAGMAGMAGTGTRNNHAQYPIQPPHPMTNQTPLPSTTSSRMP